MDTGQDGQLKYMLNQQLVNSTRELAFQLAGLLEQQQTRIVFAESCTAGLASALLAQVSGISDWLCGSAVTYRESVKQDWLNIDPELIRQHTAVSAEVTQKMAEQVLRLTPQAQLAVAVTGHLEETAADAPCLTWVCPGCRDGDSILVTRAVKHPLSADSRVDRQWQAAGIVLETAIGQLGISPAERRTSNAFFQPDQAAT